jgi:hypothetical protein
MARASLITQLTCKLESRVGLLAVISGRLAEAGVNMSAVLAYEEDDVGEFTLVCDDTTKAAEVLSGLGAEVGEESAVSVEMENEAGALADVSEKIAEAGVNIYYVYATACGDTCDCTHATVIFHTDDDTRAFQALSS